jgi:hypothetical protein
VASDPGHDRTSTDQFYHQEYLHTELMAYQELDVTSSVVPLYIPTDRSWYVPARCVLAVSGGIECEMFRSIFLNGEFL